LDDEPAQEPERPHQTEATIEGLQRAVGSARSLSSVQQETLMALLEVVWSLAMRPLLNVSSFWLNGDRYPRVILRARRSYFQLHQMIGHIVRALSAQVGESFLSDARLGEYLSAFDCPDLRLQFSLEGLMRVIAEKGSKVGNRVCGMILRRLTLVIGGVIPHFCIDRYFRILLMFFSPTPPLLPPEWFTRCVLPTFRLQFLASYYTALEDLCSWAYGENPENGIKTLKFMLAGWPKTNSGKLPFFLRHLPTVVAVVPDSELEMIVCPLFARIADCIGCQHGSTAGGALKLISESEPFLMRFKPFARVVAENLRPALVLATDAWHQMENSTVSLALEVLETFDKEAFDAAAHGADKREKEKCHTWQTIGSFVTTASPGDVPAGFEVQLNTAFKTAEIGGS
jgi:hypothetical protein